MEIIITEWALNSYLELKQEKVDRRRLAKFKGYLDLIRMNCYIERGKLT